MSPALGQRSPLRSQARAISKHFKSSSEPITQWRQQFKGFFVHRNGTLLKNIFVRICIQELDIFSAKTLPGGEDDDDHKAGPIHNESHFMA